MSQRVPSRPILRYLSFFPSQGYYTRSHELDAWSGLLEPTYDELQAQKRGARVTVVGRQMSREGGALPEQEMDDVELLGAAALSETEPKTVVGAIERGH